jgi:bifunctional DNA-binding transcriptional regulator/antitoxin component of YhaV-PrlF toxin-antitoxin module
MWVADHTLVKNGNSAAVTIPRTFLHQLGWIIGRRLVIELDDDRSQLVIRLPQQSDFGVPGPPRVRRVETEATK